MNIRIPIVRWLVLVGLCALSLQVIAQTPQPAEPAAQAEQPAPAEPQTPEAPTPESAVEGEPAEDAAATDAPESAEPDEDEFQRRPRRRPEVVSVGSSSTLEKGETASELVSIFGSSTNDGGEVFGDLVSVFGNSRTTGPVHGDMVAVLGSVYINNEVRGDVVAVIGNIELGPEANVHGEVVCVGGTVIRDPGARVYGGVQRVLAGDVVNLTWLQPWLRHAVVSGRPLAFAPGLGWAWGVAFGFLAFYALLAVMFRGGIEEGVRTIERYPGKSVLASLAVMVLSPVGIVLLCITIIGLVLVPFVGLALLIMGLFGKAVLLAALGRRITMNFPDERLQHPALAVIIGGLLILVLYVVPVVGFITYKVLGILGTGVVAYTLILRAGEARRAAAANNPPAPPAPALAAAAPAGMAPPFAAPAPQDEAIPGEQQAQGAPPATPAVTAALPRAGFWIRMAALALDGLLIILICSLLDDFAGNWWPLLLAAYGAVLWKVRGTTVGGIICGLRIVRLDGREMDWPTAVVRALGCFLSAVVAGLGFIWIAFDPERQAWHDKIAGTVVVLAPRGASLV